ncbi:MAG: single-stranded DNA-binding protein [Eubacterium sp.]|nr:single-stranded DNA-binding protein [Eubacterium sp.]
MKVIGIGRLVADPEIRYTEVKDGKQYCIANYRLAATKKRKTDDENAADFFTCVSFGKTAEVIGKYLKKGSRIMINGNLDNNKYTDKNGQKVYQTRIIVEEIEFADSKKEKDIEEHQNEMEAEILEQAASAEDEEEIESFM